MAIEGDARASVCVDCARHLSLKRVIEARPVAGTCAFCCRTDAKVRDPDDIQPMVMLIRALIRFHWHEHAYNRHWDGGTVLELFQDDANPVVTPPVADTYLDEFDETLQWPPYPDPDKGISIYAGFEGEHRLIWFAISRTDPRPIRKLRHRLRSEAPEDVRPALEALVAPFLPDIRSSLPEGELSWRARIGVKGTYRRAEGFDVHLLREPYRGTEIGASPKPGNGRLNREGQSVLYLGSSPHTALAEIRPHPGHHVSIGGFKTLVELRMADFDPDIALFATTDERLEVFRVINAFERMMSTPVTPDDKEGYQLTQLLAEVLAASGFDGVMYRSSVSDGLNFCLFDPNDAQFVEGHSEVRYVKAVRYEEEESQSLLEPGKFDEKIDP